MSLSNTFYRAALIICLMSAGLRRTAAQVTVFAAASLMESLKEIGSDYKKQTGQKVVFNFAASSTLARQIEEGAPADIFFSADEAQMDRLERKKLVIEESRRNRLSNSLVVIVGANGGAEVHSPKDLAGPSIHRIALGDPKLVPIGVYARNYLEQKGLWEAVATKVVPTENVRAALAAVESGNADASIVYATDALISKNVRVTYRVGAGEGPEIRYPVALLKGAKDPENSKRFFDFLAGDAATKIFEARGFLVVR